MRYWLVIPFMGLFVAHRRSMQYLQYKRRYDSNMAKKQILNMLLCVLTGVITMVGFTIAIAFLIRLWVNEPLKWGKLIVMIGSLIGGWCAGLPCIGWLAYIKKMCL